jgi:hypothetical protein
MGVRGVQKNDFFAYIPGALGDLIINATIALP